METKVVGLLALSAFLAGCGDGAAPAVSGDIYGSPEDPSSTDVPSRVEEPAPTATNKYADCVGDKCVHGFFLKGVKYVVFPGGSEALDPASDEYVVVPGTFDITFVPRQDDGDPVTAGEGPDRTLYRNFSLPSDISFGLGFQQYLTLDFHLVDSSARYPDIECHLALFSSGVLTGAIVREPGTLVCSTHNWESPQTPEQPGLLLEYALCGSLLTQPTCEY